MRSFPPRRPRGRRVLPAALLPLLLSPAGAPAQTPVPAPAPAQAPRPAIAPPAIPGGDTVLVTVNDQKITKAELLEFLRQYTVQAGREEEAYQAAAEAMVNRALLSRFLDDQKVSVTDAEIDGELDKIRKDLKEKQQGDLASFLAQMQVSPETFRNQLRLGLRWSKYLAAQGSDQALRDYFQKNYDLFSGTQVKASHILIKVPLDASEETRQAARQKLLDIKKEIADGKLTFAEAANKYSEDESNRITPDGGNLDYFGLRGNLIDSFCDAAFALKPGEISDPVETELGYHLILVTDRAKGQEVTYDQIKGSVQQYFGNELQQDVVEKTRKASKITIQPMPADFFPKPATPPPGPPASPPTSTPASGKIPDPKPPGSTD